MTFKEAAYFILKREKRPMTAREIVEIALKEKLIKTSSKSPDRDLAIQIYDDIRLNGENSPFVKVGRGLFGLREFYEQKREETVGEVQHLIRRLEETQYRSNSPSEFEEVLKEAFSFLGFETELKGEPGNTDVVLKAKIGRDESYTVNVDGKTSRSGKISDVQIDWLSLEDHREKTKANFIVVVGPDFSKGNVEKRAQKSGVVLLKVKDLIELLKEHARYPFNLLELKRLFETPGNADYVVEEIIRSHRDRTNFLENLKLIVEEMENLQSLLGYFSVDSLVARTELGPQMIKSVIDLLNSPLIKAVEEVSDGKYVLVIPKKELSKLFGRLASACEQEKEQKEQDDVKNKLVKNELTKDELIKYLSRTERVPTVLREILLPLCLKHGVVSREMIKEELVVRKMAQNLGQAGLVLSTVSKAIGENELLESIIAYDKFKPWKKDNFRLKEEYKEMVHAVIEELKRKERPKTDLKNGLVEYLSRTERVPTVLREILLPLCLKYDVVSREMVKKELVLRKMAKDLGQAGLVLSTVSAMIGRDELLGAIIMYDKPKPWKKDNFRLKEEYKGLVQEVIEELKEIKGNAQQKA
jgi:uncharacterized protein YifN (PemK superfamily)